MLIFPNPRTTPSSRIVASHVCPPIPSRDLDWCAWDDRRGADASPYGHGKTKVAAIIDFAPHMDEPEMSLEDARAVFADMPHHSEARIDAAADALLALGEPEEIDAAAEWLGTRV